MLIVFNDRVNALFEHVKHGGPLGANKITPSGQIWPDGLKKTSGPAASVESRKAGVSTMYLNIYSNCFACALSHYNTPVSIHTRTRVISQY